MLSTLITSPLEKEVRVPVCAHLTKQTDLALCEAHTHNQTSMLVVLPGPGWNPCSQPNEMHNLTLELVHTGHTGHDGWKKEITNRNQTHPYLVFSCVLLSIVCCEDALSNYTVSHFQDHFMLNSHSSINLTKRLVMSHTISFWLSIFL